MQKYLSGWQNSLHKSYYESGNLEQVVKYKNGKPKGRIKVYQNGKVKVRSKVR